VAAHLRFAEVHISPASGTRRRDGYGNGAAVQHDQQSLPVVSR
jgi:hypothetical protein